MKLSGYRFKWVGAVLLGFFCASCSVTSRSDPEVFRVGELEVWLYQDQSRLARDLAPVVVLSDALRIGNRELKIFGYYDRSKNRIYSINDARVLLHEFKHFLEPHWRHEIGSLDLEPRNEARRTASVGRDIDEAADHAMTDPGSFTSAH